MSNIKQVHYNIDKISEIDANYYIIYGEKSNGKTYQVKTKKAILHYLETGMRFILLRRWREDVTNLWVEQYFNEDLDIAKMTNNRYNYIECYRKVLYFANVIVDEETGEQKKTRGEKIGYVMSLSTEQHYSGASFLDVDTIIFEEFMERGMYIGREPSKFEIFYNTIDRKRGTTKVFMVGNTISRVCPYIKDWGLEEIFSKLKQGNITTKTIHNETNDVVIAIEYCQSSGGKQMSIGSVSSMVEKGSWQTFPQPKLPKSYNDYNKLFQFGFQYKGFRFLCELLYDKKTFEDCWFIYPYSKEFDADLLVFSDEIKTSKYWQCDIYNPSIRNDKLKRLLSTFRENKIFYSSDLCGTDFKQVIDFMIKK